MDKRKLKKKLFRYVQHLPYCDVCNYILGECTCGLDNLYEKIYTPTKPKRKAKVKYWEV